MAVGRNHRLTDKQSIIANDHGEVGNRLEPLDPTSSMFLQMLMDMSSQHNLYSIVIHGALISFKINVQYHFAFPPEIFGLEIQNLSFLDIYLFPSVSGSLCTFSILWAYLYGKSKDSVNQKKLPVQEVLSYPVLIMCQTYNISKTL